MTEDQREKHAVDLALARYAIIAPLVSRPLNREQRRQVRKDILSSLHRFPDGTERRISERCLNRFYEYYRHGHRNRAGELVTEPGLDALRPLPRSDQGTVRVLEPEWVEQAVRLRSELPTRSTAKLIELIQDGYVAQGLERPEIPEATLAYHLRARHATREELEREGRAYPRYEHLYRNASWQGDWSQGIPLPDPLDPKKTRLCHLHAFIDDHTRYVPHAEFYFRQNLPCLEDAFRKATLHGGVPEMAYWDNGAVYQSRQIQLLAARLGIQVVFATPYAPEGKGKIERFFRTAKDNLYPEAVRANIQTLDELNAFLWAWLDRYHDREHSQTGTTPRARWEAGASGVRFPDPASLVDLFLWEETRKVDKSGCISLSGNHFPAGEDLVGKTITVRFDPFDLAQVRLYLEGRFLGTATPQTLTSRTYRKALPRRVEKPAPLESSTSHRKQLSDGYRREVQETLKQVRPESSNCLTRQEFAALLVELLALHITVERGAQIADFFQRNAPLDGSSVRSALVQALEEKGPHRHLRFYLDAVRANRLKGEPQ